MEFQIESLGVGAIISSTSFETGWIKTSLRA
jgi:hypothetical protein